MSARSVFAVCVFLGACGPERAKPPPPTIEGPKACTMEAKICPDGTAVSRTGPNCEFVACPKSPPSPSTSSAPVPPN